MDIINNADLPIKRLVVNPNLAAPNYRAVYLITSNYYDLETIKYQALNGDFREYPNYEISGSQYVVVDINQKFSDGDLFVIEDNYTKAIFVISKSDEYFYFDIKYPKLSHYRFRSRHNVNGKARISRDEMNYFTILGKFIGIIEFE